MQIGASLFLDSIREHNRAVSLSGRKPYTMVRKLHWFFTDTEVAPNDEAADHCLCKRFEFLFC